MCELSSWPFDFLGTVLFNPLWKLIQGTDSLKLNDSEHKISSEQMCSLNLLSTSITAVTMCSKVSLKFLKTTNQINTEESFYQWQICALQNVIVLYHSVAYLFFKTVDKPNISFLSQPFT